MKRISCLVLLVALATSVACPLAHAEGGPVAQTNGDPTTLNTRLDEPGTLDPALVEDAGAWMVAEQLFLGLVDLDDVTGAVLPELATSWTVSPDGTAYTFTLRSDAKWSDGSPITAHDARFALLRALDPATGSAYATVLYPIRNGEGYHNGTISDPTQVGVASPSDTQLRITLEQPTAHFSSILSLPVARPVPQAVVSSWGPDWSHPDHIVSSGPYKLTGWVHDDHVFLEKNPYYYSAAGVEIDQVKLWIVDQDTGWTMYRNGHLETTEVPWTVNPDDLGLLAQEVHTRPTACTYYYGFNTAKAPFHNCLVRKALAAAIDRQGLVTAVFGGYQQPALTFTPPGIFGHVDGLAEGVGIPYDPMQARAWLQQAGYPNGQGLPAITLWFNTNPIHQSVAEYVQRRVGATTWA
mgnify:CR=1 FL=1